jgi:hypothetical protein
LPKNQLKKEEYMAKIIENKRGRRMVRVSTDDVIMIVREYQNIVLNIKDYETIREQLNKREIYLPEEV